MLCSPSSNPKVNQCAAAVKEMAEEALEDIMLCTNGFLTARPKKMVMFDSIALAGRYPAFCSLLVTCRAL